MKNNQLFKTATAGNDFKLSKLIKSAGNTILWVLYLGIFGAAIWYVINTSLRATLFCSRSKDTCIITEEYIAQGQKITHTPLHAIEKAEMQWRTETKTKGHAFSQYHLALIFFNHSKPSYHFFRGSLKETEAKVAEINEFIHPPLQALPKPSLNLIFSNEGTFYWPLFLLLLIQVIPLGWIVKSITGSSKD